MKRFEIHSNYLPTADQPEAIAQLVQGLQNGKNHQILKGVTGSGKTFTMANIIEKVQRPTLILAHNKTLAAQLFMEFKQLFPNNSVEFFISYYDYYQPESYIVNTDTYIEKDSSINENIDKMRHSATKALLERPDVLIVCSVSCIYGIGDPDAYRGMTLHLDIGQTLDRDELLKSLIEIQYERSDIDFHRGTFRVRGDIVDIIPADEQKNAIRLEFFGNELDAILIIDPLTGEIIANPKEINIFPNSHYVTEKEKLVQVMLDIERDLQIRLQEFKEQNKLLEYQRIEQRTMHDLEMLQETGYCSGIENYSRYLTGRAPGEAPPTLLEYFPKDFLMIIDESHVTVPQIGAMYKGDRSRKENLVNFGFRLPSALDNRPLMFNEFEKMVHQTVYVSATPGRYELEKTNNQVVEQVIRPTCLLDPEIIVKPTHQQVNDLQAEMEAVFARGEKVLVTTLTKTMSEELSEYYRKKGLKIEYLHADIDSLERVELLRQLRKGEIDAIIGINLLREGLDLPEVSLVAILDADKEGFLRSASALIQTAGRAARNVNGRVIFYADKITAAMDFCISETKRRRTIQHEYNLKHNITPQTIRKEINQSLSELYGLSNDSKKKRPSQRPISANDKQFKSVKEIRQEISNTEKLMKQSAANLDFEKAAQYRDYIFSLRDLELLALSNPSMDT